MKTFFFLFIGFLFQVSFAYSGRGGSDVGSGGNSAKCPKDTKVLKVCVLSPMAGDSVVAPLDSAAVCQRDSQTLLVFEKGGESTMTSAKLMNRAGEGVVIAEDDDVSFTVSYATEGSSGSKPKGQFTMLLKEAGEKIELSLVCH